MSKCCTEARPLFSKYSPNSKEHKPNLCKTEKSSEQLPGPRNDHRGRRCHQGGTVPCNTLYFKGSDQNLLLDCTLKIPKCPIFHQFKNVQWLCSTPSPEWNLTIFAWRVGPLWPCPLSSSSAPMPLLSFCPSSLLFNRFWFKSVYAQDSRPWKKPVWPLHKEPSLESRLKCSLLCKALLIAAKRLPSPLLCTVSTAIIKQLNCHHLQFYLTGADRVSFILISNV